MDVRRLIIVPQYPSKTRYQEWWFTELPYHMNQFFQEVHVLGKCHVKEGAEEGGFAPLLSSVEFEMQQIKEYLELDLRDSDVLLLCDPSFPGFFCQALFHKKPRKMFCICHATSLNNLDYFEECREEKSLIELTCLGMMDGVFVATKYHEDKLKKENPSIKTHVVALPDIRFAKNRSMHKVSRNIPLVSVSRPTPQKVDMEIERLVESSLRVSVYRRICETWEEYFLLLCESQILFISAKEETYGYQVVEALRCGCFVVAPKRCSYPEILPAEFLYETAEEAVHIISQIWNGEKQVPTNLMQHLVDDFYINIKKVMKCK